ncbi:MAG: FkbM family methyltransferase [Verrucomicrobia bacterium]|nr:FkbM family methyltransferase [Verrucomicrobiota bacterium]
MLKPALKSWLKRAGLHLFTDGSLPPGADWLVDLKKLGVPSSAAATFFDVGANVGQTVFEVRAAFPAARIFAFEPFPTPFAELQKRTASLPGVQVFPLALGASSGALRVDARETSELNSLVGAKADSAANGNPDSDAVQITVETLDTFCQRQGVEIIDVLKTDTEGYDLEVLRGGERLLQAGRVHYIYTEVTFCAQNAQNSPFAPLFEHLAARDFHFLGLYETYSLHHFAEPNVFCNALFVHRSQRPIA